MEEKKEMDNNYTEKIDKLYAEHDSEMSEVEAT